MTAGNHQSTQMQAIHDVQTLCDGLEHRDHAVAATKSYPDGALSCRIVISNSEAASGAAVSRSRIFTAVVIISFSAP